MLEYSQQEKLLQAESRSTVPIPIPPFRKLRGYAFDPSLSLEMDTASINEVVYKVIWEPLDQLSKGPIGEYIEVIDFDPASGLFYQPIDLNDHYLLAQDGLAPSEANPQFHQQMVYAVSMTVIKNVERALGRWIFWNGHFEQEVAGVKQFEEKFVQRLRLYPHALREANAYYSPDKKSILFGYFPAVYDNTTKQLPGGIIFSCLSHDIIAHEVTHAVLDGIHRRYIEDTNPDCLAFHEAFADLVALFQHFSFPEVLYHQIAKTKGDLSKQSELGQLAQQFGRARGNHGSLRSALGQEDENGVWQPAKPDPAAYETVTEFHERGGILVAAMFDVFLTLYKNRIADLLRIATNGTGILPAGDIHPDLVKRLADEAAKTSGHILTMCIRALDYCPPVDLTFGDFLRALITADYDVVSDDARNYRIAIIDAFRKRGIYPKGIKTLSPESLRWELITETRMAALEQDANFHKLVSILKSKLHKASDLKTRSDSFEFFRKTRGFLNTTIKKFTNTGTFDKLTGLLLSADNSIWNGLIPKFEIHSLRSAQRVTPEGDTISQAIMVITQHRELSDRHGGPMTFRGGCTLIFDLTTMTLRYCIRKGIDDHQRIEDQQQYLLTHDNQLSLRMTYFGPSFEKEPFALLHRL